MLIMITALVGLAVTPGAALGAGQVIVLALSVLRRVGQRRRLQPVRRSTTQTA